MTIKRGAPYKYDPNNDVTDFHFNTVANDGGIAVFSTAGSGVAPDAGQNVAQYATSQSGTVPIGLLMNNVVNIDLTRYPLNRYNSYEVNVGSKVHIHRRGTFVVDNLYPGQTPTAGAPAYLGPSGLVQTNLVNTVASPKVGKFQSTKDQDGYFALTVEL